ncbi:uncharacterized protein V6R79_008185 [Siganus canaliculatus]
MMLNEDTESGICGSQTEKQEEKPLILASFDIHGAPLQQAEHIRLLLEYTGTKYVDKIYPREKAGEMEDEMKSLKKQAVDFRNSFLEGHSDLDKLKPEYLDSLPDQLKQFSDCLGNNMWFAGDSITFVDFIMYELLDQHRMFQITCLDDFQNLKDLMDRFETLDKISAYMKSDRYKKNPVGNSSSNLCRATILTPVEFSQTPGFRFLHQNIRSIKAEQKDTKMHDIKKLTMSTNPDVMILTETWLKNFVGDSVVDIDGYNIFRCERCDRGDGSTRGGGVAIYVKNTFKKLTDHHTIAAVRDTNLQPRYVSKESLKALSERAFLESLIMCKWTEVLKSGAPEVALKHFQSSFLDVIDKHAPFSLDQSLTLSNETASLATDNRTQPDVSENSKTDFRTITVKEVRKALRDIDPKKPVGPDGLDPYFIQIAAYHIAKPLAHIFNLTLKSGRIPDIWKVVHITPLLEEDGDPADLRPILIHSVLANVLEALKGIPQGSPLGTILLAVYIDDLCADIKDAEFHFYEDNVIIYSSALSPEHLEKNLQSAFDVVQMKLCELHLSLNADKTKMMCFSIRKKSNQYKYRISTSDRKVIQQVPTYEYLGFVLEENLSFSHHIDRLTEKLTEKLQSYRQNQYNLSVDSKERINPRTFV